MALPRFWLGTHEPNWLRCHIDLDLVADETGVFGLRGLTSEEAAFVAGEVGLFISRRRFERWGRRLHRARCDWALDSSGFTELHMHGRWTIRPREYANQLLRLAEGVGRLQWAAPMDWMCEPSALKATGQTIRDHQQRTIESVHELRHMVGDAVPVIPVLQGWTTDDYLRHVEDYADAGIDLQHEPVTGWGSQCRREGTRDSLLAAQALHARGVRLHGFGIKGAGLALYGQYLVSADSMAWSFCGRRHPDPACGKGSCANCLHYALAWRAKVMAGQQRGDAPLQLGLGL